jgi:hypothetical protein
MAVKMMISEKTLDAVVTHQFSSANAAMKENDSLEISGFGKFLFNRKKAQKMMEKFESQRSLFSKKLEDPSLSERRRNSLEIKLQVALDNIRDLKPKLYESVTDLRGMEEQLGSAQGVEGSYQEDQRGENEDMRKLPLSL